MLFFKASTGFILLAACILSETHAHQQHHSSHGEAEADPILAKMLRVGTSPRPVNKDEDGPILAMEPRSEPEQRKLTTKPGYEVKTIWEGDWGVWKGMKGPSIGGYYACGASLRFEAWVGDGDDTAANGLKMNFCHLNSWYTRQEILIYDGVWGDWTDMMMCPEGYYIDGAQVRYEDSGEGDGTAANGLKIHCRSQDGNESWVTVHDGLWGDWKPSVKSNSKFVSAAEVKFEDPVDGDDTATNGLFFEYEYPSDGITQGKVTGQWKLVGSGQSQYKKTMDTTWTDGGSTTDETALSVGASISGGFEFAGASASVTVTGSFAQTASATMSSSLAVKEGTLITVDCDGLPGNFEVLWQWVMSAPEDASGPGFASTSNNFRCTDGVSKTPKCPLGSCGNDIQCQTCVPGSPNFQQALDPDEGEPTDTNAGDEGEPTDTSAGWKGNGMNLSAPLVFVLLMTQVF